MHIAQFVIVLSFVLSILPRSGRPAAGIYRREPDPVRQLHQHQEQHCGSLPARQVHYLQVSGSRLLLQDQHPPEQCVLFTSTSFFTPFTT